jgi:hypothetical protein
VELRRIDSGFFPIVQTFLDEVAKINERHSCFVPPRLAGAQGAIGVVGRAAEVSRKSRPRNRQTERPPTQTQSPERKAQYSGVCILVVGVGGNSRDGGIFFAQREESHQVAFAQAANSC